jgi:hypothetical protein
MLLSVDAAPAGGHTPRAAALPAAAPLILSDRESIAKRLMHSFPWNPTAQVNDCAGILVPQPTGNARVMMADLIAGCGDGRPDHHWM